MSNTIKLNKFESLYKEIPKYPEIWDSDDVLKWLKIIGMDKYNEVFIEMGIDGLLILELEESDIEEELRIKTKLHRKKIMKALDLLKEYTDYLKKMFEKDNNVVTMEELEEKSLEKQEIPLKYEMDLDHRQINEIEQEENVQFKNKPKKAENLEGSFEGDRNIKIIIKSIEGPSDMDFTITSQGTQIGRHSTNQIVIFDESVSRYHAEIYYNIDFYLRDIGSTTGTFIKINDPLEIKENLIFEIGSYQFIVSNVKIFESQNGNIEEEINKSFVEFTIYESPEDIENSVYKLSHGSSIGRKQNNTICFADDLHMSNLHCKINLVGKRFVFEDIASTNGSWLRLSQETEESEPKLLKHGTIFKIGNSAMYEVHDPEIENKQKIVKKDDSGHQNENRCTICWDAERDCLLIPCRHNVSCTRCIKSLKNCPICRTSIHDIIKIYKS